MVLVKDGPHNPNFSFNITTHKPKHHVIILWINVGFSADHHLFILSVGFLAAVCIAQM